ncbi:MAG: ATP-dependent helicase [bacterium]
MGQSEWHHNLDFFDSLNPVQRKAVETTEGPVLIVAGAGSGKTRVLTYRVAHLIQNLRVPAKKILAVTFTNKAAQEMRERIVKLTGGLGKQAWLGTFHAMGARLLRVDGHHLGYSRNFSIYDREDQIRFVRSLMKQLNISTDQFSPEQVVRHISKAKSSFMNPDEYKSSARESLEQTVAYIYGHYQKGLVDNNTMDFDDLLVNPIYMFEKAPDVLKKYQEKFAYILVDEFQDTNRAQYIFLKRLASKSRNLCVVGDDDQSIYRWRGADIQNILNIEKDFPECQIFNLVQNYRSTQHILDAANSVVEHNLSRRKKTLWTEKNKGEKVTIFEVDDAAQETSMILQRIKEGMSNGAQNFSEFAILYRTNSQSRALEDAFRLENIPYKIIGGIRFYERKEIKDVLAYLQLICNPKDSISFKRVINFPLRGIGETSVAKIEHFAHEHSISLFEAARRVEEIASIATRTCKNIIEFGTLIEKYASLKEEFSAGELTRALIDEIGMLRSFKDIGTEEALMRAENVKELLSAIKITTSDGKRLEDFLEEVSLITDIDSWDQASNAVTLMTLHSAKGLEFPTVFIAGLEEGLFPLSRTYNDNDELEEERRLFYVGATRAQEKLYLSWASQRMRYGENFENLPSRFLNEIGKEFVERKNLKRNYTKPARYNRPDYNYNTRRSDEDYSQEVLTVGTEVSHTTFGVGRVTAIAGRGENTKVTIKFYELGEKKLVVKYANLKIIG